MLNNNKHSSELEWNHHTVMYSKKSSCLTVKGDLQEVNTRNDTRFRVGFQNTSANGLGRNLPMNTGEKAAVLDGSGSL